MDCSLPGSSVRGTLQARILEWVATSFSRGSSQPRDQTWDFPGKDTGVGCLFLLHRDYLSKRDGTHPAPGLCNLSLTHSYFQGTRKCICKQTFKNTAPLRLLSTPSYAVLHLRIWKSNTLHAALRGKFQQRLPNLYHEARTTEK